MKADSRLRDQVRNVVRRIVKCSGEPLHHLGGAFRPVGMAERGDGWISNLMYGDRPASREALQELVVRAVAQLQESGNTVDGKTGALVHRLERDLFGLRLADAVLFVPPASAPLAARDLAGRIRSQLTPSQWRAVGESIDREIVGFFSSYADQTATAAVRRLETDHGRRPNTRSRALALAEAVKEMAKETAFLSVLALRKPPRVPLRHTKLAPAMRTVFSDWFD